MVWPGPHTVHKYIWISVCSGLMNSVTIYMSIQTFCSLFYLHCKKCHLKELFIPDLICRFSSVGGTVKMNALFLINKIVATDYKQND